MYLSTQLITPPGAEPITLAQAKQHLRCDFDDEDSLIEGLIKAAREYAEKYTRRAFFTQTWKRTLDHFPLITHFDRSRTPNERDSWPYGTWLWDKLTIELPHPQTVSVTSIIYLDPSGIEQTLDPSAYNVDVTSIPARITPTQGKVWPIVQTYVPGSVVITFVAGSYGDGVETNSMPQSIVQAMLLLIGHWYQNRESVSALTMKTVPMAVNALLDFHRVNVGVTR